MSKEAMIIIYTNRPEVRTAVRDELRKMGYKATQFENPSDEAECKDMINRAEAAMFVLDWGVGPEIALAMLEYNFTRGKIDSCITFLIAARMDKNIIAAATEYQVSQIHTGEISIDQIKGCLQELQRELTNVTPVKRLLKQVATFRSQNKFEDIDKLIAPVYPKMASNPRLAIEYGQNLVDMGRYQDAEEVLVKAAALQPPSARAKNQLARLYLKIGKREQAATCLQGAQIVNPYNVRRLVELGDLFMEMGKPNDANSSFDKILDFAPKSKEAKMGKGSAMIAMGQVNEALTLLKESTNMSELASVFNNSAIVAIQYGNHDEAIKLYQTAISAASKNKKVEARLWFNMGIGYVKWKKLGDSLQCFSKSASLDPAFEPAKHNIQVVENATGKPAKNVTSIAKAKQARPPQPMQTDQAARNLEADHEALISEMEETIGAENLAGDLGNMSFDLDFDDDLLD